MIPEDELVPGTVHLIDLEGDLDVKKGHDNIILRPPPTSNPNDPLRWSQRKKQSQFFLLFWLATFLAITVNFSGPIWDIWVADFNTSYEKLNISSALCFLFLGVGCLLLQPTALIFGRRFVYLSCVVLMMVANIIGAVSTSIEHLYAVNIIGGFAAAPCDSLIEISVTDTFFQHERATYLSFVILCLYFGSDIGPIISGYIADTIGWRWCFWLQVIMFGLMFIWAFFFMDETCFRRSEGDGALEEDILQQIKSRESGYPMSDPEHKKGHAVETGEEVVSDNESVDKSIAVRTYWRKRQVIETEYGDTRSWLCIFYRPFFMITFPAIIWCGLVYGAQMMWLSLLATTQALIYSGEPYNFSAGSTGLTNFGPLIGSLIGLGTGPLVDWITLRMARKNNGIMEPEFRLYAMVLPLVTNAVGLLAYGLGAWNGNPWPVSVIIGQGFLGFAMSSSGTICLTYVMDCYHRMASEALVLVLFIRNMIGMGFTFAIQPWLDHNGLKVTTWLMFMLSIIINGSFIILVLYGKKFRKWTKNNYYKFSDPTFGELFKR